MESYIERIAELQKYGIKKETELVPDPQKEIVISKRKTRTVRNITNKSALSRIQSMFGNGESKGPNQKQADKGISGASGTDGAWGKPE